MRTRPNEEARRLAPLQQPGLNESMTGHLAARDRRVERPQKKPRRLAIAAVYASAPHFAGRRADKLFFPSAEIAGLLTCCTLGGGGTECCKR